MVAALTSNEQYFERFKVEHAALHVRLKAIDAATRGR